MSQIIIKGKDKTQYKSLKLPSLRLLGSAYIVQVTSK